MPRSRSYLWRALIYLACHLTLVASGDDFSLLRVVVPSAFSATTRLPGDDPNSDFVRVSDADTALRCDGGGWDAVPAGLPTADASLTAVGPPPSGVVARASSVPVLCADLSAPLRC